MTDEQLKLLAEAVVINLRLVSKLGVLYAELTEQLLPLVSDGSRVISLISDLEQLQAAAEEVKSELDLFRGELGIE